MLVQNCVFLLVMFTWDVQGGNVFAKDGYIFSSEASGWLKFYSKPREREDAWIVCDKDGAVIASPVNVPVRDAIKRVLGGESFTILTGVQADLTTGDFFSLEHVPLSNMPVMIERSGSNIEENESSEKCVAWNIKDHTAKYVSCDVKQPFVCYRRQNSVQIVGCGTTDKAYKADLRTNSCYKYHVDNLTWNKAYKKCFDEGAKLAVINSDTEAMVLKELLNDRRARFAFINARDWDERGKNWESEGKTLEETGFSRWHEGEPNNYERNEHCVTIADDGDLYDNACHTPKNFICEKNQVKLNT